MSVIMPTFDVEAYVAEAVDSLLAQTARDFEVIVVDDGSTDGTCAVLRELQRRCASQGLCMTVIEQGHAGVARARNVALRAARGAYVGFLDADDTWHPEKIERHLEVMDRSPELDVTFSWFRWVEECGADSGVSWRPNLSTIGLRDLIRENPVALGTMVVRREALDRAGSFDESLSAFMDLDICVRIAGLRPGNIACIPEVLLDYRVRPGQITKDWERMTRNWERILERTRRKHPKLVSELEAEARARRMLSSAVTNYKLGDYRAARNLVLKAWREGGLSLAPDRRIWKQSAQYLLFSLLPDPLHDRIAGAVRAARVRSAART